MKSHMSRSLILSMRCSIAATCSFEACPWPVMAIFIFIGAYSCMGTPWRMAAAIAVPCALPSLSIDCTFLPKKGASMAISSGRYESIIPVTRS